MDKILEAVMQSSYPMYVKQSLARRVIEASKQPIDTEQCWSMLELSTKLFFLGESRFARETAREVLEVYGRYHPDEFEEFFNEMFIMSLLQEGYGSLGKRHAYILDYIHHGLQFVSDKPSAEEIFRLLRIEVLRIVCERPSLSICVRVSKLLSCYPQCVPEGNHRLLFCQQMMRCIGQFHCHSEGEEGIIQFLDQVNRVSALLQSIWRLQSSLVLPSLKELFAIISLTDEMETPSSALASVVQYIPLQLMEGIVRNLANSDSVTDAQMMTAINRMIDWVSWPLGKDIDKWIIALLKGLAAVKKFSILTEVSLSKIQKVFSKLLYPVVREAALSVLRYMLLSFQHSPDAFHLIVPHIPQMVSCLSNEGTNSASSCLEQLAELVHCMVFRFSGYPDLYEPVMEAIKKLPVPNEDRIKQLLGQNAWTSQKNELAPYYPRLVSKSDTGKIGLVNLGNTCYMNSILQALFMASDFRHSVLCLRDSSNQPLMMKLQHVFAFLEHSQRPAISPESFLASFWPPWFTPGVQQDCSEYLKYLLDRLHEEEKTGKRISQALAQTNCSFQVKKTILGNRTLVEKMFGGRIVTKIRCLKCHSTSAREEAFTDLSLAFPPRDDSKTKLPKSAMSSGVSLRDTGPKNLEGQDQQPTSSPQHGTWKPKANEDQGKVIPVKLSDKEHSQDKDENNCSLPGSHDSVASSELKKCSLTLSDLINHFLCPEMLTEDNQYRCETCSSLQDAEKVVELTTGPQYLILTLLRFSFDLKAMRRRKILDNVSIPLMLKLPVQINPYRSENGCIESSSSSRSTSADVCQSSTYDLCTVIVHSGLSSESGHYYCYSRDCMDRDGHKPPITGMKKFASDKHLDMEIQWYLFNDTRVSFSSFESVSNITSFFPKDTAYVLFYRHRTQGQTGSDLDSWSSKSHGDSALSKELMEAISKDNIQYLQEQEKEARNTAAYISPLLKSPLWWQDFDKDSDDDSSAGGLGSGAGGSSGSFHGLVF
ncbi:ubiquitin carboxyl-terminal hydrolase 35 [Bufo bufo]|uniref:ubiquitin carboxyl-terminal hydrolase 35 n=1 Tax=Bufo bufo TaxID=8384 RepID=UPI001ABE0C5A|nr:ubiquitin carboxyl-terminal hydrolase 35 [Bufo bufo]XP_040278584.1 ubiquitin carboxyl-terminal hydrolase 35 [Bufo bufo]